MGVIRREDPNLRDGSPFTGSAASLPALPDFVRVRADAFPQSAGEATAVRIARKEGRPLCTQQHTNTLSINWNGTTGHFHLWKGTGLEYKKARRRALIMICEDEGITLCHLEGHSE